MSDEWANPSRRSRLVCLNVKQAECQSEIRIGPSFINWPFLIRMKTVEIETTAPQAYETTQKATSQIKNTSLIVMTLTNVCP